MSEAIITALISSGLTLVGVLVANGRQAAVTETRLDELTREVREHNNFAHRVPLIEERLKAMDHRLAGLEAGGGRGHDI